MTEKELAIILILTGGAVSFRLIVIEESWAAPDWENILLLLLMFSTIAYGTYLLSCLGDDGSLFLPGAVSLPVVRC